MFGSSTPANPTFSEPQEPVPYHYKPISARARKVMWLEEHTGSPSMDDPLDRRVEVDDRHARQDFRSDPFAVDYDAFTGSGFMLTDD